MSSHDGIGATIAGGQIVQDEEDPSDGRLRWQAAREIGMSAEEFVASHEGQGWREVALDAFCGIYVIVDEGQRYEGVNPHDGKRCRLPWVTNTASRAVVNGEVAKVWWPDNHTEVYRIC